MYCKLIEYTRGNRFREDIGEYRLTIEFDNESHCFSDNQNNNSHVILVSVHSSYCQTEPLVSINHETQKAEELCLPASQQKKVQRKRRTKMKLDKPFELSTTIHSDRTLNKIDYFLSKYIDQLYSDKHPLY